MEKPAVTTDIPEIEMPTAESIFKITDLGDGLRVVSMRRERFSKELAEKILALDEVPSEDRPLLDKHVTRLLVAMQRGTFRFELVRLITCVCKATGKTYRINGQHTCWARTYMPDNWAVGVDVEIAHYSAQTEEDVRILYASVDRGMARTRATVIHTYLSGTEAACGAGQDAIKRASQGFSYWKWDTSAMRSSHDGDDVAYLMQTEYLELTKRVISFMIGKSAKAITKLPWMRRSPVIGAMFATFHVAPNKATEFWSSVRDGLNFQSTFDPRKRLRDRLMETSLESKGFSDKKVISQEQMYRSCIYAWNAWRRGEEQKQFIIPATPDRPKPIR